MISVMTRLEMIRQLLLCINYVNHAQRHIKGRVVQLQNQQAVLCC